jgi:hypothetical protein
MTRTMRSALAAACLLPLLMMAWAPRAQALYLGNPAPDIKKGEFGLGLALSDLRATVFGDIGISDAGTLELQVSDLDVGGGQSATEVGATYRHKVGRPFKLGKFPVTIGVLGGYRLATLSHTGGDLKYNQIHLGVGGAITPLQHLNAYATVVYERSQADVVTPFGTARGTESNLGFVLGAEYWIFDKLLAGLEINPGLDDDSIAIYAEFKF